MSAAIHPGVKSVLLSSPALIRGLSWGGFALLAGLYGMWALHLMLMPSRFAALDGTVDLVASWLAVTIALLVGGTTSFLAVIVVLNAATRAGSDTIWVAIPAAVAGCVAAWVVTSLADAPPFGLGFADRGVSAVMFWIDWAMAFAVGYKVLLRVHAAREKANQSELRRKGLEKQQAEAHLRLLQAQIEPHFLFNTLSNIRRLCQNDAASGRAMLAQLTRYLRAALPKMRSRDSTLADEIDLVAAYLGVQKFRMGDRLQVSIEVPAALRGVAVPPMMLATLAENSIKHGIAPLAEGGAIRIGAACDGGTLTLEVADTGQGFTAVSGTGVGLANVRARLMALYGERAALQLRGNLPHGLVATITLPMQPGGART